MLSIVLTRGQSILTDWEEVRLTAFEAAEVSFLALGVEREEARARAKKVADEYVDRAEKAVSS